MNPLSLKLRPPSAVALLRRAGRTRIGIDAQFWGAKDRGLGRYTEKLVKSLKKIDDKNQYIIFSGNESRGVKRHLLMPFKLKKYKLDLMHFTHFNVPIFYRDNFVVTIHDLNFNHVSFLKRFFYKIVLRSAVKRANKIIAVSQYTKEDILEQYKVKPEKIKVIYEGVS